MAKKKQPKTTRLSDDVTKPQPTDPGDAPADTFDEKERAVSVTPDKKTAASNGYQTVNAVISGDPITAPVPVGDRNEVYTGYDNDGNSVEVVHNVDTGFSGQPYKDHAESTAFVKGDFTVLDDHILEATVGGTSASTAPTVSSVAVGDTVSDGGVTWTVRTIPA